MISAGDLSIGRDASGAFGMFPVSLRVVPRGFVPTEYRWKIEVGESTQQSASGERVDLNLLIGSKENLRYEHRFQVTASDKTGNTATARYTIHLEPPAGFLFIRYDDPRSQVGASSQTESEGFVLRRVAYKTVLVEARTEGLLGHVSYTWSPDPVYESAVSPDLDQTVFKMLVSGDSNDVESYEGVMVKVQAIDEIGQSVSLQKFADAVTEFEEIENEIGSS